MSTPAGQGGAVTVTSKWQGRSLVSEGALKVPYGDTTTVREVVTLSSDGKTLTMEVMTTAPQGDKASSTLVYTNIMDVGPCEKWPTPCKRFPWSGEWGVERGKQTPHSPLTTLCPEGEGPRTSVMLTARRP